MSPSADTRAELDRLLFRWCEGEITVEEGTRLEALVGDDRAARQYCFDYLELNSQLIWEFSQVADRRERGGEAVPARPAGRTVLDVEAPPARKTKKWRRRAALAGMAATLAGALAAALVLVRLHGKRDENQSASSPIVAHIRSLTGKVELVGPAGDAQPAAAGDSIRAGQSLRTAPENGQAVVDFEQCAAITFCPDAELLFPADTDPDAGEASLIHQRGVLQLEVKPRRHDRPLVLRTPHAALCVLGTTFRSLVGDTVTRVEVEEGRVEVTRGSDRQKTEVGEGDYLLAGSNREPLRVRAAPITVTEALRTLNDVPGDEHVRAIAYLGDSVLATGGSKGSVKLWDLLSGEIRALSPGHTRLVRSIALAPDGRIFASGSEDRSLRFWDAATGEPAPLPVLTAAATGPLGFSAGGELLAVACPLADRRWTVRLWSMDTGQCEAELPPQGGSVISMASDAGGRLLAVGDREGYVTLADVRERRAQRLPLAHEGAVTAMAFSPDGRSVASGGKDGAVVLWDVASRTPRATLRGHTAGVVAMAFCPDRKLLASSDNNGITRLWDVGAAVEVMVIWWPAWREARTALAPDGRTVATAGTRGKIKLWKVPDELRDSAGTWEGRP